MHTSKDAPIITFIRKAMMEFAGEYGIQAEKIHVSLMMEGALTRWALANLHFPQSLEERVSQGASIFGLEVVKMTKNSAVVEFYLSAERAGQLYTSHAVIEPETVGIRKVVNENGITLGIDTDED